MAFDFNMFEIDQFFGYLIQGKLRTAMDYLKQYPEESDRLTLYERLFEEEQYIVFPLPEELQKVMLAYQRYYRDVFYLEMESEAAADVLYAALLELQVVKEQAQDHFGYPSECYAKKMRKDSLLLGMLEEKILPSLFEREGLHFMGGRTGGFHGPCVWKNTDVIIYQVELPQGTEPYTVRFHRDFVTKGWLDYLSFGAVSVGGWTDGDGIINCIADCYDLESEAFRISLLKHEAQHVQDLRCYPGISREILEYRAKLVELIYSEERDLLAAFTKEAGGGNGHAAAAERIVREMEGITDREGIRKKAEGLLWNSIR